MPRRPKFPGAFDDGGRVYERAVHIEENGLAGEFDDIGHYWLWRGIRYCAELFYLWQPVIFRLGE